MVPINESGIAKMETALEALWERSRFTSYFYQSVDFIKEAEIPTIALVVFQARFVFYYAENFVQKQTTEELIGLLVHEMMHIMMNHNHRAFPDEDIYLQNLAQDMVINSYIKNSRKTFFSRKGLYAENVATLEIPHGLPVIPVDYIRETSQTDPPWESLYQWLLNQPKKKLQEIQSNFDPDNNPQSAALEEELKLDYLNNVMQNPLNMPDEYNADESVYSLCDMEGIAFKDTQGKHLPTGVHMMMPERLLQQVRAKKTSLIQFSSQDSRCLDERAFQKVNGMISEVQDQDTSAWSHKIKSLVDFSSQSSDWKYTHSRFNRRYFAQGIYAAGRVFEEKSRITVAVDVSASVITHPEVLEAVFGVVDDLTRKYTVHLVCIDEQLFIPEKSNDGWIQSGNTDQPYIYNRGDWKYIKTGSKGTTFFSPLFNDYMKQHREMLLVITDGQIFDLERLRPYPSTLWIIPEEISYQFTPPFGQMVPFSI